MSALLPEEQVKEVRQMIVLVDKALEHMIYSLEAPKEIYHSSENSKIEREINAMRDELRYANVQNINDLKYDYHVGASYNDIVCECERLGDYIMNVVEAKYGKN